VGASAPGVTDEPESRGTELSEISLLGGVDLSSWTELINRGTVHAVTGLAEMLDTEVKITCFNLRRISVGEGFNMFGGPQTTVVGVYLSIEEGASGHIVLAYPPAVAFGLIDMLMGKAPGTTDDLGEMEESALAEVGNVVGSFFLNSLADDTGIRLKPSPPHVVMDEARAVLCVAIEDVMQYGDDLFMMETVFESRDKQVNGLLLVLPSAEFLDVVKRHREEYGKVPW